MKKILISLFSIGVVAIVAVFATQAFFSDEEVSRGNILAAGAIDLGVDNHSFYNGLLNDGTTWRVDYDLSDDPPRQFFNFADVKPGDWGEDTISLHVKDNEAWLCADVTLTSDDDNGLVDPEEDDGDVTPGVGEGELADAISWYWWADDGDNVLESCVSEVVVIQGDDPNTPEVEQEYQVPCVDERLLPAGPLGALSVGQTAKVTLADSIRNIWTNSSGDPLDAQDVVFLGKAWCFGSSTMEPYPQDGGNRQNGPDDRPVVCDGTGVNNLAQTDSFTADIAFRAVQSRHNESFVCDERAEPTPSITQ